MLESIEPPTSEQLQMFEPPIGGLSATIWARREQRRLAKLAQIQKSQESSRRRRVEKGERLDPPLAAD